MCDSIPNSLAFASCFPPYIVPDAEFSQILQGLSVNYYKDVFSGGESMHVHGMMVSLFSSVWMAGRRCVAVFVTHGVHD